MIWKLIKNFLLDKSKQERKEKFNEEMCKKGREIYNEAFYEAHKLSLKDQINIDDK